MQSNHGMTKWCQIKPVECDKKCNGNQCILRDKKQKKNELTICSRK